MMASKVRKKANIRIWYDQKTHATEDTIWASDKKQEYITHNKAKRSAPLPASDHKAARNRQDSMAKTNTKHKLQRESTKEVPPWKGQ